MEPTYEQPLTPSMLALRRALSLMRRYHRHEVVGLEHVPTSGAAIGVVNHSLATYDLLLLGLAIMDSTGRVPTALADDLLFKTPGMASICWDVGLRPGSHAHGQRLLRDGRMVWVAPGGMREALRPSAEAGQVRWEKRRGFVRLALREQVPLLLAGCPEADKVYTVVQNPLTALAYRQFKVPLPVAYGWFGTTLPRPIQLTHHIAPLVYPPAYEPEREEEQVADLHADLRTRMEALLACARNQA